MTPSGLLMHYQPGADWFLVHHPMDSNQSKFVVNTLSHSGAKYCEQVLAKSSSTKTNQIILKII